MRQCRSFFLPYKNVSCNRALKRLCRFALTLGKLVQIQRNISYEMREIRVISETECNIWFSIHEAIIVSPTQGNINHEILEVK